MLLLIDADIPAYSVCANAEEVIEWEQDDIFVRCNKDKVKEELDSYIEHIVDKAIVHFDSVETVLCLSSSTNFRKSLQADYKANRKSVRKPVGLRYAKDYLSARYAAVTWDDLEADDVIGVLATANKDGAIIVSADKDLLQIPGYHLIDGELIHRRKEECEKWFMVQTLSGDRVDNYTGCPGIGPVKAEKLLTPEEGEEPTLEWMWAKVVEAFEKAGLTDKDALTNARLAYILQTENYAQNEEVVLWNPPTIK